MPRDRRGRLAEGPVSPSPHWIGSHRHRLVAAGRCSSSASSPRVVLAAVMLVVQAPESRAADRAARRRDRGRDGRPGERTGGVRGAGRPSVADLRRGRGRAGCHAAETDARGVVRSTARGDAARDRRRPSSATSTTRASPTSRRHDDVLPGRTDGTSSAPTVPTARVADFRSPTPSASTRCSSISIAFPDGRLQALHDRLGRAAARGSGGQRWFHLYPERARSTTATRSTGRAADQNWNFVLRRLPLDEPASQLRRRRPIATRTTWTDLSVACEACHGPGSSHVAWAEHRPSERPGAPARVSRSRSTSARDVAWLPNAAGNARRSRRARCAPRGRDVRRLSRAPLTARVTTPARRAACSTPHAPAVLEARLYHPDGQQLEEVYTYGSFLQSKMYAAGVTCSDCHEPHGGSCARRERRLRAVPRVRHLRDEGPPLTRAGSAGAACVACHMPARTYMLIDPRHDHSLRVPRPDLAQYGVPNACNGCHADRDAAWAAGMIEQAHGPTRKGFQNFVAVLVAAREGAPGAFARVSRRCSATRRPRSIVRATALAELPRYPSQAMLALLMSAVGDPDPLVRRAALEALESVPPPVRAPLADQLADDPVKGVRVVAGRMLTGIPEEAVAADRRAAHAQANAEYVASQRAAAELPRVAHQPRVVLRGAGGSRAGRGRVPRRDAARARLRAGLRQLGRPLSLPRPRCRRRRGADRRSRGRGRGSEPVARAQSHARSRAPARRRAAAAARAPPPRVRRTGASPCVSRRRPARGGARAGRRPRDEEALGRAPYDRDLLSGLATFARDAGDPRPPRAYAQRLVAVSPGIERGGAPRRARRRMSRHSSSFTERTRRKARVDG